MRFIPPLVVSAQQVDAGMEIFESSMKAAEKRITK